MSKRKNKAPHFVMVRRDLMKDPAWRQLPNSAKIVYIYMRGKFNYRTLQEVTLAYSEMKDMMSSRTISKAFKELIKGGWIERVTPGGLFGGVTVYRFVGQYKDFYFKGRVI